MKGHALAFFAILVVAPVADVAAQGALVRSFPPNAQLGMIASDGVRLRSKPSTGASVVATENTGALGTELGESDDAQNLGAGSYHWEHLKMSDGTEGWVFGQFVVSGTNTRRMTVARLGSKEYVLALLDIPLGEADRTGLVRWQMLAFVDPEIPRALPIKVKDSPGTPATNEGWLYLSGDDEVSMEVASAAGIDGETLQVILLEKRHSGGDWESKTKLTCAIRIGARYPYFEVIRAETSTLVPVWVDQSAAGSRKWASVASSTDGTHLAAVDGTPGDIWTSADSGVTWVDQRIAGTRQWGSIASSSDGTRLAAGVYGGDIFTSTDAGATWTDQASAGSRVWWSIASSSDGTRLAAVDLTPGDIWTSTDSGATWTDHKAAGTRKWESIVSSSDGTHLAAVATGGTVWTSTDSGAAWSERKAAGSRKWVAIASSSDGAHLAAVVEGGAIWTSSDSGTTWAERKAAGSRQWESIASSSDGSHLAAVEMGSGALGGDIWTSTDSGATWTDQEPEHGAWFSVASSADGARLAVVELNGDIWTGLQPP
jgi:hypothetical protein